MSRRAAGGAAPDRAGAGATCSASSSATATASGPRSCGSSDGSPSWSASAAALSRMRLAFVVQRYGAEVAGRRRGPLPLDRPRAGGARRRGRGLHDHRPRLPDLGAPLPGRARREDGAVTRAPLRRGAAPTRARSAALARAPRAGRRATPADEAAWARAQGPVAPGLLRALATARPGGTRSSRSGPTSTRPPSSRCRSRPSGRSWCRWPTTSRCCASASRAAWCAWPRGLAFMTPEERRLVDDLHGLGDRPEGRRGRRPRSAPRPATAARARAAGGAAGALRPLPGAASTRPRGSTPWCARTPPTGAAGGVAGPGAGRAARRWTCGLPGWVRDDGLRGRRGPAADLLEACEVVVLPSPHESLSLVALEAWRAGRPTLATGALRGARRPDRALGRRPALPRRPEPTRASSPGSPATRRCAGASARAGARVGRRADLGRLRGALARAAGAGATPAAGALSRVSPVSRCQARSVDQAEHQAGERPAGATRREHLARGGAAPVEPARGAHPDAWPSRSRAGRSGPSAAAGTRRWRARCRRSREQAGVGRGRRRRRPSRPRCRRGVPSIAAARPPRGRAPGSRRAPRRAGGPRPRAAASAGPGNAPPGPSAAMRLMRRDRLAPGGVGAADALHDVLEQRAAGEHAPAAVPDQIARAGAGSTARTASGKPVRSASSCSIRAHARGHRGPASAPSARRRGHPHAALRRLDAQRAAPAPGPVQRPASRGSHANGAVWNQPWLIATASSRKGPRARQPDGAGLAHSNGR